MCAPLLWVKMMNRWIPLTQRMCGTMLPVRSVARQDKRQSVYAPGVGTNT